MNKKVFENVRFTPKGDIEANWERAYGFVPLDREIIIYKPDENHPYSRIKIGDGVTGVNDLPFVGDENVLEIPDNIATQEWVGEQTETLYNGLIQHIDNSVHGLASEEYVNEAVVQSDWNQNDKTAKDYIKNRPFYHNVFETAPEYYLDLSTLGTYNDTLGDYLVKVSDDILKVEDCIEADVTVVIDQVRKTFKVTEENIWSEEDVGFFISPEGMPCIAVITNAELTNMPIGIYFLCRKDFYVDSFISPLEKLKKLDKKFLPDGIAYVNNLNTDYFTPIFSRATSKQIQSIFNGEVLY